MQIFSPFLLSLTPLQIAGCIALIVICVALIVYLLLRRTSHTPTETVVGAPDALVGETGVVTETVDADAGTGLVEINGEGWAARSVYTDDIYEVGASVTVVAVEGVKVIVKEA